MASDVSAGVQVTRRVTLTMPEETAQRLLAVLWLVAGSERLADVSEALLDVVETDEDGIMLLCDELDAYVSLDDPHDKKGLRAPKGRDW